MALVKPKDLQHEQAALNKRLKYVQELKQSLQQEDGVAYQTVAAYTSIVDGAWNHTVLSTSHVRHGDAMMQSPLAPLQTSSTRWLSKCTGRSRQAR